MKTIYNKLRTRIVKKRSNNKNITIEQIKKKQTNGEKKMKKYEISKPETVSYFRLKGIVY